MNTYFSDTIAVLSDSVHSIDISAFERLISECIIALDNGHKIVATGLGKNVPICDKFVGTMLSFGQNANFMHTNSAVHGDLGIVQDNDVVIVLTKSGETVESLYLADLLQKRNVSIWLLSFSETSTLAKRLAPNCIILSLQHEGDPWNIAPINSTTVNLIILQELAMEIAKRRNVTLNDYKKNHPGGHIGVILKNV